ncbi:MAG: uroporphyrinogen decarboxylase family protein [Dehalococcoidia bacterium]
MSKSDRVFAAARGQEVDRVPVSAWWHDYLREWSPEGLAAATLEAFRKYDWDFIKVNPRACYYAEDWGSRFLASGQPDRSPKLIEAAVKSPSDLRRIGPLDVTRGAYGQQLAALAIIDRELAGEAPFIQTVFSPLAVMSRLCGTTERVKELMREQPDDLRAALAAVAETLAAYARACREAGAAGIFFATVEWGSAEVISGMDFDRFARPFDLTVLEAVKWAPVNVLHVCGENNHLRNLLDYNVTVLHWAADSPTNSSLAEISDDTARAVMGGVAVASMREGGSATGVSAEARRAIEENGGRRFFLAPGCSVSPQCPEGSLRALREAAGP